MSNDEILMAAIEEAFKEELEKINPKVNETDDDALIGQKFRASEMAKTILYNFFITLEAYKTNKSLNNKFNKAI